MNLDKEIRIRYWCYSDQKEKITVIPLKAVVEKPTHFNMADLGVELLNQIREDLGLSLVDPSLIAGSMKAPEPKLEIPFDTFKNPYCKGAVSLGTACGRCEKCKWLEQNGKQ